ncbi:SAM-dependent methyltransferase [Microbispora sp. GKU 823]|uniref:SAM-dependent methyltransferase n=1 Tax=Microbispora sp. GKU 823 TaxID=1652100 RepID=UPI0021195654|nr:SAM-dependent methyltransferase [Microbispora sp. GKU 823]
MEVTWREAMRRALYGAEGFYLRERPDRHFRTSVHVSPVFAEAVLRLLLRVDAALGRPDPVDLVDMGSGNGLLAARVRAAAPPDLAERLRVTAVDLSPRPGDLDPRVAWEAEAPYGVTGLVIANEWLDNVPLDIAEMTPDGPRLVLVDTSTGEERLGPAPGPEDLAWLERWWPLRAPGERAEIGHPRDEAWASLITRLARGTAVAVDYAHPAGRRPPLGTVAGYREGSVVPPIPDGRATSPHTWRWTPARRPASGRGAGDHAHHAAGGAARPGAHRRPAAARAGVGRSRRVRARARPGLPGGRADRPGRSRRLRLAQPGGQTVTLSDSRPRMM